MKTLKILSLLCIAACTCKAGEPGKQSPVVLAYVTSWSSITPDPAYLTHINYAFGHVNNTFNGVRIDNEERLKMIAGLKQLKPSLKVLLSIGGWGSGRFSEMAADAALRKAFAADCQRVVQQFGLDGIDIDWEFPTSNMAKISASPDDTKNFTLLMEEIRKAIGNNGLLTLASNASAKFIDFNAVNRYLDFVNIMTYDMASPPKHHAALYRSEMTGWMCGEESVNAHIEAGIPPEKLTLGIPFYGHGKSGIANFIDYKNIAGLEGYTDNWDDAAKAPYLTNASGEYVCTYENVRSIDIKCQYLLNRKMLGAMYWDYDGDDPDGSLRKAVYNGVMKVEPVRIGIDGLSHSHVHGLLNAMSRNDIRIVGIAESDSDLAQRYSKQYGFDMGIVYGTVEEMVAKTKPEGVLAFNSIYDHLHTVEVCAPRGIHVMVEKPLAVSVAHAERMAKLSRQYGTMVLTNYETTWYPSNRKVYAMAVAKRELGDIRKVIVCDGHQGPKEIGCNAEFLAWLTDPKLNGGGAVVDFGCYGANLMTWLMQNRRPVSVSATLQHIKPDVYPKVDDEATIVLTYPHAQAIIQASWNWPVSRKDMEVYGATGYAKALNARDLVYRLSGKQPETGDRLPVLTAPEDDPFRYFAAAVRGTVQVAATDLSSLENNLIVVEILETARKSAASGKTVKLK